MNSGLLLRILSLVAPVLVCMTASGATWFVRPDGGTRYSQARLAVHLPVQCDGLSDLPYPGTGSNRHCAFNDVRFLWEEGTPGGSTGGKWIITGGDTVIVRGSIEDGVSYRIGWPNAEGSLDTRTKEHWGVPGDPYGSGAPAPPSGTELQHTRIVGGNFESCHNTAARTQLHGGFGVGTVLRMNGASYVDLACLDITDFSACGRASQKVGCNTNPGHLDDYATTGISWSNTSTHDTLTDVSVHGLAGSGMTGPTGDGTAFDYLSLIGNAASGWNADSGDGTTGSGSLQVRHYDISWNGCAEQYPTRQKLPYDDCTDDNVGGYGDGFGTASTPSHPGWAVVFDQGLVSYNTQDGLDALHLTGAGSSTTVTHTLAFGNMGQQIKIGGNQAIVRDNVIYANCTAMRESIPGTPASYNIHLSDFCRAADTGIFISVNDGSTTAFERNIVYSAGSTMLQVGVNETCSTPNCVIQHNHNIFVGFPKNKANGYIADATGEAPNPIYLADADKAYSNPRSSFSGNTVFHVRKGWPCPNRQMHETDAHCVDPHLKDETWHRYGYGDTQLVRTNGNTVQGVATPTPAYSDVKRTLQAIIPTGALLTFLFTGLRSLRKRKQL